MKPDLLNKILEKAKSESVVSAVALYNWTDPLLHPNLGVLIREVKSHGISCIISSNLNTIKNLDEIIKSNPDHFRISLSGFTQEIYDQGHKGGNIEIVKRNMIELSRIIELNKSNTVIEVFYHRYIYNSHEIDQMKEFSKSLGFKFSSILAQLYPVEKIIKIANGERTVEDDIILPKLALTIEEAIEVSRQSQGSSDCTLLEDVVAIDVNGNVVLCCGSSADRSNSIGSFLDNSIDEIQKLRHRHSLCGECYSLGIPTYFLGRDPAFEIISSRRIENFVNQRAGTRDAKPELSGGEVRKHSDNIAAIARG